MFLLGFWCLGPQAWPTTLGPCGPQYKGWRATTKNWPSTLVRRCILVEKFHLKRVQEGTARPLPSLLGCHSFTPATHACLPHTHHMPIHAPITRPLPCLCTHATRHCKCPRDAHLGVSSHLAVPLPLDPVRHLPGIALESLLSSNHTPYAHTRRHDLHAGPCANHVPACMPLACHRALPAAHQLGTRCQAAALSAVAVHCHPPLHCRCL